MSGRGTTRPRAAATSTPGMSGTARPPTAAPRGLLPSGSPMPAVAPRTRPRPVSPRSTATTARPRSRTRARRSRSGARGSATPAPVAPGSTASHSTGHRGPRTAPSLPRLGDVVFRGGVFRGMERLSGCSGGVSSPCVPPYAFLACSG